MKWSGGPSIPWVRHSEIDKGKWERKEKLQSLALVGKPLAAAVWRTSLMLVKANQTKAQRNEGCFLSLQLCLDLNVSLHLIPCTLLLAAFLTWLLRLAAAPVGNKSQFITTLFFQRESWWLNKGKKRGWESVVLQRSQGTNLGRGSIHPVHSPTALRQAWGIFTAVLTETRHHKWHTSCQQPQGHRWGQLFIQAVSSYWWAAMPLPCCGGL